MNPKELAEKICGVLRDAGHQAYLVGGCVRDLVLGREPADYDVATDALPERVQQLFPDSIAVGAQFGVIIVAEGSVQVEVATFRSDVGYSDGRHPDRVTYARSPEEDIRRRDFTINGLLLDPRTGEVLDFVGGRDDLRAGLLRAIGEPGLRFREDKLRMVRAVRFAARLDYAIEPATLAALRRLAPQVTQVSAERLRDELTKLLTEGAARRGFARSGHDEGSGTAAAVPPRRRRVDPHPADAREARGGQFAYSRVGRTAPRRGQAADVYPGRIYRRPHPIR